MEGCGCRDSFVGAWTSSRSPCGRPASPVPEPLPCGRAPFVFLSFRNGVGSQCMIAIGSRPILVVTGLWVFGGLIGALAVPEADATFPGANGEIAFEDERSTLSTVDPHSGRVRRLTRPSSRCRSSDVWQDWRPSYSPSGRQVAFVHYDDCGAGRRRGIYVVRADGTGRRLLVRLRRSTESAGRPAWSADGRRIAFIFSPYSRKASLFIASTTQRDHRRLTKVSRPGDIAGGQIISWGPAKAALVATAARVPGRRLPVSQLGVVRPDGGGYRRLGWGESPDWSPDATRIAFLRTEEHCPLESARLSTSGVRAVSLREIDAEGTCYTPASVYVMRSDGHGIRRVTSPPERSRWPPDLKQAPTWSPDGRQLAFLWSHSNQHGLYVVAPNGGGKPKRVATIWGTTLSWQALRRSTASPAAATGSTRKPAKAPARMPRKQRVGAGAASRAPSDGTPTALVVGLVALALLTLATVVLALRRRYNGSSGRGR